jgi:CspA family cold shock protein
MEKGVVRWFNAKRGYGFIQMENGSDIFVHFSQIKGNDEYKILYENDKVQFTVGEGKKGRPEAIDVMKVS